MAIVETREREERQSPLTRQVWYGPETGRSRLLHVVAYRTDKEGVVRADVSPVYYDQDGQRVFQPSPPANEIHTFELTRNDTGEYVAEEVMDPRLQEYYLTYPEPTPLGDLLTQQGLELVVTTWGSIDIAPQQAA